MPGLLALTAAIFAVLCAAALRRGLRGHVASLWLAVAFAALVTAGIVSRLGEPLTSALWTTVFMLMTAAALLAHPVAMVEFVHTLAPVGLRVRRATRAGVLLLLAVTFGMLLVDPNAFSQTLEPLYVTVLLACMSVVWLWASVFAGWRLLALSRRVASSLGRSRAVTMAMGVILLAPAVTVPLVTEMDESAGFAGAAVMAALIYLGYAPPQWLRWTWAHRDTTRLAEVELRTLQSPTAPFDHWLQTVMEIWGADEGWFAVRGEELARRGARGVCPGITPTAATAAAPDGVDGVRIVAHDGGCWEVIATVADGCLGLHTRVDPVLFGDEESELLLMTAARMRGARARQVVELRRREAALAERDQAHEEQTARLRDDVLATLSHELRTPLVVLRGIPELLLARWDQLDLEDVHDLMSRMHANALTLHRLVEATLLLADVRAGVLPARVGPVPVPMVIENAMDRLATVGRSLDRVRIEALPSVDVDTDARLMGAVLAELIDNALTYSEPPEEVVVLTSVDGIQLCVHVLDRGRGLPEGLAPGMLNAFARAGEFLTRDRRGLGIGLTLATDLCDRVGAGLDIRTREQGGVEATVALPLAAVEAASATQPEAVRP